MTPLASTYSDGEAKPLGEAAGAALARAHHLPCTERHRLHRTAAARLPRPHSTTQG